MNRIRLLGMAAAVVATALVAQVWAAAPARSFQGYWMGIDPIDGGDQRRSFVKVRGGTYSVLGRDSFLRLCDDSDRGIITAGEIVVAGPRTLSTERLELTCIATGLTVPLKARWELAGDDLLVEHVTTADGEPVQSMPLHKVSR